MYCIFANKKKPPKVLPISEELVVVQLKQELIKVDGREPIKLDSVLPQSESFAQGILGVIIGKGFSSKTAVIGDYFTVGIILQINKSGFLK